MVRPDNSVRRGTSMRVPAIESSDDHVAGIQGREVADGIGVERLS